MSDLSAWFRIVLNREKAYENQEEEEQERLDLLLMLLLVYIGNV